MSRRIFTESQLAQLPPGYKVREATAARKPRSSPVAALELLPPAVKTLAPIVKELTATERMQALGRLPVGTMNKTEQAYEGWLKGRQLAGEVLWYKFELVKLRLADNTFYTPDFFVMNADRGLEVHEVKGQWTDDARVKIKVAAELCPIFKFVAVQKGKKGDPTPWRWECF